MVLGSFFLLVLIGLTCSLTALALRAAEAAQPASDDIEVRGGLGHMLIGVFAGLALIAHMVGGFFLLGIVIPLVIIAGVFLTLRWASKGSRLRPLYRYKLGFSVTALMLSLVLWFNIILLIQGVSP